MNVFYSILYHVPSRSMICYRLVNSVSLILEYIERLVSKLCISVAIQ